MSSFIRRTNNNSGNSTRAPVVIYILLLVYAGISIFFSLIFGFIGLCLAWYALYQFNNVGGSKAIVTGIVSFLFSTLSYLTPVILVVLLSQGVITTTTTRVSF